MTSPVNFERPPVIETVLGVQFIPLAGFDLVHFGLFWDTVRADYPRQEVKPPLAPVVEDFPLLEKDGRPQVEITVDPSARAWLINGAGDELLQLQRDRFIRNWRKTRTEDTYPRYETLRPRFERDWRRFLAFLEREGLGAPEVTQCEVTYINHIEVGQLGDVSPVLKIIAPSEGSTFLPKPELVVVNTTYAMPSERGRLHVAAQPALRRHDRKEIMQLTLTARGKPAASDHGALVDWLDQGHKWITQGFVDITTTEMQELWGRT